MRTPRFRQALDQKSWRGARYLRADEIIRLIDAVEHARGGRSMEERHLARGIAILRADIEARNGHHT